MFSVAAFVDTELVVIEWSAFCEPFKQHSFTGHSESDPNVVCGRLLRTPHQA